MSKKFFLLAMLFVSVHLYAQEEEGPVNLSESYETLYSKSGSYNEYKVIKAVTLKAFWATVEDSLQMYRQKIAGQKAEIGGLSSEMQSLEGRIATLERDLDAAVARADGFEVFGALIPKTVYNLVVWGIVALLVLGSVVLFGSHMRSQKLYTLTRKEFRELVEEFEDYRKKSYDKKIKMGRELQDERNKVEELKKKLSLEKGKIQSKGPLG
jgi:archaellum component FlaC